MLILMGGHYDVSTGLYRLRIDAFLMTMTVFTFVLTSALLLMCTIMGSTELPNSVLLIGLVLMLILMGGHYDVSTGLYRLRIDAFLMTMTVFTFVLTSALLLMCTIMGSTELPNSVLYRINYLLATITYFPFTVGFIFEEYMHGDIKQTVAGGLAVGTW
ncbi:hypothetical protein HPB50_009550 [Hyalomma asiaticum]|uniref:Uncharacterized protein n=1 Tax=Hyalomma asiaticum TaxID=266040 RepID=A0ACB7TFF4_HYAAI|nr:hypothetical protein HPB50_009550 [Hyalomma asiaticum]